jgi:hypothetical protein
MMELMLKPLLVLHNEGIIELFENSKIKFNFNKHKMNESNIIINFYLAQNKNFIEQFLL